MAKPGACLPTGAMLHTSKNRTRTHRHLSSSIVQIRQREAPCANRRREVLLEDVA